MNIGIMQGRLTDRASENGLDWFPLNWEKEFIVAKDIGFDYIEFVQDRYNFDKNPLNKKKDLEEFTKYISYNKFTANTICLNWIIENNIFDYKYKNKLLVNIKFLNSFGFKKIVLPLFGKSEFNISSIDKFYKLFKLIYNNIYNRDLLILLESDEKPKNIKIFLDRLKLKNIKLVYDIGNAAFKGYKINEDFLSLNDYIGHIHIKDKNNANQNVSLGKGLVDFKAFKKYLKHIKNDVDCTLETNVLDDAYSTQKKNLNYLKKILNA